MQIPLTTLRWLVCLLLFAAGQVLADTNTDIEKLERERFAAYVQSDVATLDKIFADDMVYIHSNGLPDTKAGVLQSFASGDLKISQFEAEEIKVRPVGNTMVAVALIHVELVNKGTPAKFDLRGSAIYVNQGGQWRLAHVQNARVPPKT